MSGDIDKATELLSSASQVIAHMRMYPAALRTVDLERVKIRIEKSIQHIDRLLLQAKDAGR